MSTLSTLDPAPEFGSPSRLARTLRRLADRVETHNLRREQERRAKRRALALRRGGHAAPVDFEMENARLVLLAGGLLGPEPYWRGFGGHQPERRR